MRTTIRFQSLAILLAIILALSPFLPTNKLAAQENRERRVGGGSQTAWTVPADAQQLTDLGPEPTVRVGLATDMRSVTISTTGQLMNASALNVAAVHTAQHQAHTGFA